MLGHNLWKPAAAVVAMLLLVACGGSGADQSLYKHDESVNAALIKVSESGTAIALREVTSVEWDEVALFSEGTTRTEIEAVVGPTELEGERFTSSTNLLVFRKDGEPVALSGTSADVFDGEYRKLLGADATLSPAKGRNGLVVLTGKG